MTVEALAFDPEQAFLGVDCSLNGNRWRARATDERLALALSQRFALPEVVGRVMAARGIALDAAESWLQPTLRALLPNPSVIQDMDRAAERIADAVQGGERIAIFGDYDVDGATSTALLSRFLGALGAEPLVHIPDRQKEGYGPNAGAMESLAGRGAVRRTRARPSTESMRRTAQPMSISQGRIENRAEEGKAWWLLWSSSPPSSSAQGVTLREASGLSKLR